MVELKAADRRAIRSDSMERKSPAREIVYGLFKSAAPFTLASKIASDDRKSRNKVLPEIPVIVDNAWPSGMIASEVIHDAGMLKYRCAKVCLSRIVDKRSRLTQKIKCSYPQSAVDRDSRGHKSFYRKLWIT